VTRSLPGILLAILVTVVPACLPDTRNAADRPRLVVVIVVDQMCDHHVTRFRDLYTGGLKRLLDEGAVFNNAWHDHAKTHTSPGHASISTGSYPSRHGIVANQWYDRKNDFADTYSARDENAPLVGSPDRAGASPAHLLCDGLGDWLKRRSRDSKVYSVALKDYASVLMGGQRPDAAYWYDDETGTYCSSTHYMAEYPEWVTAFNAAKPADAFFDGEWTRSMPAAIYQRSRVDAFAAEADGEHTAFPHSFRHVADETGPDYYDYLQNTPFADELTLRFATGIVDNEKLGVDDAADILFVGCSAADFIGHEWGPFSQEAEDYYLRFDDYLGAFLGMLDERVGSGRYTVVLTSDHGAVPIPESRLGAERIPRERYLADVDAAAAQVARELGVSTDIVAHTKRGLVLSDTAAAEAGIPPAELRSRMAEKLRRLDYIDDVFTYDELAGGSRFAREYFDQFDNNFHTDRGADLNLVVRKYSLVTGMAYGTTHGSPHDYDRRVPLLFWGNGVAPGIHQQHVRTVDIAPTLASILAIDVPESIDGIPLVEALEEE
jgi:predicted AlkP superfamily pyrophosphatase or phosphodiesterase